MHLHTTRMWGWGTAGSSIFLTPLEFMDRRSSKQRSTRKHTFNLYSLQAFTPSHVLIEDYQFRHSLSTLLAKLPNVPVLMHAGLITVQSTLLQKWTIWLGQEWIDSNPQKGEDWSKQNRPDNNDCGSSVLSAEQTFQERIQVNYHPKCKEKLAKQRPPWLIAIVYSIRDTSHHSNQVYYQQCCWRDE